MTTSQLESTVLASLVAYPIREDGLLIDEPRTGQLTELCGTRMTIDLTGSSPTKTPNLVIGISVREGPRRYLGVVVNRESLGNNVLSLAVVRGGVAEQILAEDGRVPTLSDQTYQFERSFPDAVYSSWEHAGILRRRVLDRILVCPKCEAIPTFRFGCQRCSSGNIRRAVLVHHFACACVAPLEAFDGGSSLKCPKCQTKHLIAGTDFEYAPSTHHCQDCGWKAHELKQTGHCLSCDTRFPLHQAVEQELVGYDADRLDALALVTQLEPDGLDDGWLCSP